MLAERNTYQPLNQHQKSAIVQERKSSQFCPLSTNSSSEKRKGKGARVSGGEAKRNRLQRRAFFAVMASCLTVTKKKIEHEKIHPFLRSLSFHLAKNKYGLSRSYTEANRMRKGERASKIKHTNLTSFQTCAQKVPHQVTLSIGAHQILQMM